MDICVLNPFFYPYSGGTERVLLEVYRRLAKRHNVTVISAALNSSKKDTVEYANGIKVIRLKSSYVSLPMLPMPMPLMWGLREAVMKEDSELYHINNRYLYFFDTVNLIKKANKRIALTLHDALPKNIDTVTDNGGYLYDVVWGRKMMQYADLITAVSKNTLETTVPGAYRAKARVIYNGVDYRRYKKRKRGSPGVLEVGKELDLSGSINIVNNGRLVPQKGQIYLLRAFAEMLEEDHELDLNLLVIGRGYLRDALLYMAKDLGIRKRFRIVSGIDEEVLPYYYNIGNVFVSSSLYEPASIALMEALASEVPVVATRVGGVPEMARDCGLYARPRSISDIRNRISDILDDRRVAAARAKRGRALMKKEHDWDRIARKYEDAFSSAMRY